MKSSLVIFWYFHTGFRLCLALLAIIRIWLAPLMRLVQVENFSTFTESCLSFSAVLFTCTLGFHTSCLQGVHHNCWVGSLAFWTDCFPKEIGAFVPTRINQIFDRWSRGYICWVKGSTNVIPVLWFWFDLIWLSHQKYSLSMFMLSSLFSFIFCSVALTAACSSILGIVDSFRGATLALASIREECTLSFTSTIRM